MCIIPFEPRRGPLPPSQVQALPRRLLAARGVLEGTKGVPMYMYVYIYIYIYKGS